MSPGGGSPPECGRTNPDAGERQLVPNRSNLLKHGQLCAELPWLGSCPHVEGKCKPRAVLLEGLAYTSTSCRAIIERSWKRDASAIRMWDFVVVGAGPAGSRAAELFAQRRARVLLVDPKAPWEKPCGGGLTSAALRHTPELWELRGESEEVRELVVVAPSGASVVIPLRNPYRVTSRLALARWGLDRAQAAGARFVPVAVESAARDGDGWRITDSRGAVHRARWLVAADGATSRLRGQLAPALRPELAPTRVAYPQLGPTHERAVFVFLAATEGYLWDFPRRGHHSVGIGVPPRSFARGALDEAIAQYHLAEAGESSSAEHWGAVIATSDWVSGSFEDLGGSDYVLLGDAAGLADPATGEGIDYALRSATLAAQTFTEDRAFQDFPKAARAAFTTEMRRARLIRHWLYRPGVAEQLVRRARRSRRAALLLMSLVDAVNEHGSLLDAVLRSFRAQPPDLAAAGSVCECPDGSGALEPEGRANGAAAHQAAAAGDQGTRCVVRS